MVNNNIQKRSKYKIRSLIVYILFQLSQPLVSSYRHYLSDGRVTRSNHFEKCGCYSLNAIHFSNYHRAAIKHISSYRKSSKIPHIEFESLKENMEMSISISNSGDHPNHKQIVSSHWLRKSIGIEIYSDTPISTSKDLEKNITIPSSITESTADSLSSRSFDKNGQQKFSELISAVTTFLLANGATHYEVSVLTDSWLDKAKHHIEAARNQITDARALQLMNESYILEQPNFDIGNGTFYNTLTGTDSVNDESLELALWKKNMEEFLDFGFSGSDIATMAEKLPQLLDVQFRNEVIPFQDVLKKALGFRPTDVRRILRRVPMALIRRLDGTTPLDTISVLEKIGMKQKIISMEINRWPRLLCYTPKSLIDLHEWLSGPKFRYRTKTEGQTFALQIIRQAPWLAEYDLKKQLEPVSDYLMERVKIFDMQRVLRAYPQILCRGIDTDIEPRLEFLKNVIKLAEEDVPRVVQTFPLIFAIPMERMRKVIDYLTIDLLITQSDLTKIIRAFPSLLGLDPKKHMHSVVNYMRNLGIQNVGRFVTRLPPVLGYDVKTNLSPKMDYLVSRMGLSVYDVLTFPAYFSYPLETVIEPRTEFLALRRRPVSIVGLSIVLTCGDADFAKKVAKVNPKHYAEFKSAYIKHRGSLLDGSMTMESLLQSIDCDAIGSLGGLSTSNSVHEITTARFVNDDEAARMHNREEISAPNNDPQ